MPSLKDLNCSIELSENQKALQEFGTIYGDGYVETFVPVPSKPQAFSVHLTSNSFIAPGVAIFVYVDGVYQCNRNRQDLKLRKPSDSRSLVDFRVRQKEEKQKDGSMIAREWAFDKLNIASADDAPNLCSPNILENIGCIEVVVLRCAGTRSAKSASTMNFDGASDFPDHHFGLDGNSSPTTNGRSMYDDRVPCFESFMKGFGPPPPAPSYHSPYAETVRSHEGTTSRGRHSSRTARATSPLASVSITRHSQPRSRYSEPVSPGARRTSDLPPSGFQYGSGPIPRDGEASQRRAPRNLEPNASGLDSAWLNNLLTTAVKQGVEESRRSERQSKEETEFKQRKPDVETMSQPPGAWPTSPFAAPVQPYQLSEPAAYTIHSRDDDRDTTWGQSEAGWDQRPARSRAGTRVTWDPDQVWEMESSASMQGWNSREETSSDPWDTDETLEKKPKGWDSGERHIPSAAPSHFNLRPTSPVTSRDRERRHSKRSSQRKSRSKSRSRHSRRKEDTTSSSDSPEDWTHIEPASGSVVSLSSSNDTVQPSHSRSQIHAPRSRSRRHSHHSKSANSNHERRSSRHSHRTPTCQPADAFQAPAPSATRVSPTVVNAPAPAFPTEVRSRKASVYNEPAASVAPPPPGWLPVAPEQMRHSRNAASYLPATYAPTNNGFMQSTLGVKQGDYRSTSSSSWGSDKKKNKAAKESWTGKADETADWDHADGNGWEEVETEKQNADGWQTTDNDKDNGWKQIDDVKNVETSGWDPSKNCCDISNAFEKAQKLESTNALRNALNDALNAPQTTQTPWKEQTWAIPPNNDNKPKPTDQNTTTIFPTASSAPPNKPNERTPTPCRHSNKSLSRYRQHPPATSHLTPKSHYQFPPPPPSTTLHPIPEQNKTYIAPKEARYTISQKAASEEGIRHQVRAGKATQYGHVVGRPEYLDGLDNPYAVFRFKYRSRDVLRMLFGDHVGGGDEEGKVVDEKEIEKLKGLEKEVLVEEMVRLKSMLERGKSGMCGERKVSESRHRHGEKERKSSAKTEVVARNLTEKWVERHSRGPSEMGTKEKKGGKDKEGTWSQTGKGEDAWGGGDTWGGGDVKW